MEKKHHYQGLTQQQVEESRRQHGENILTPPEKASLWSQFLEKFEDPIIRILLVAWLLSMVIAGVHCWGPEAKGASAFLEPVGIFFAIMLASCVGFFFEVKANKAFDILNTVNDDVMVKVIRDGKIQQVAKKEVVVGDIVVLETGEEVPADGTLLESVSLQINESTLTGEPVVSKTTNEADFDPEATYPSNVVMRGTSVVDGHGVMQVEKVGDATGYGKVYEGSQIESGVDTPLQIQLKGLAKVISKAGYTIATVTFVALAAKLFFSGNVSAMPPMEIIAHLLNYFMVAVTLIVVSVPEGLPMSVTLSLALSMNRMLKTNNLVRKMHACETMGATTVICTDKTGTLTQNQMQVHETKFYNLKNQTLADDELSALIQEGIAVNSTAFLDFSEEKVKTLGNPTEAALLLWLNSQGVDYAALRDNAPVISQLTFSTERKYMATVVRSGLLPGKRILYVKGAPEIVLANSQRVAMEGKTISVEAARPVIESQLLAYQNQAMRTLGFACQILEEGQAADFFADGRLHDTDLTYIGIVAISDPVRQDVPAAVQSCISAGIDVKIVTGDTPGTAREIARQIGTWNPDKDTDRNIITGPAFEALTDEEALERVLDLKIMCRARPTDKQRLVQLLQKKGAVVAVTGDGTNDAPALKAAQVGLSRHLRRQGGQRHHHHRQLVQQHHPRRHVGSLALSQYPEVPAVPADDQRGGLPHRPAGLADRHRVAPDHHADALGEPHHGYLRRRRARLAAAQRAGHERQAPPQWRAWRLHHHPPHGLHHLRRRPGLRRGADGAVALLPRRKRPLRTRPVVVLQLLRDAAILEHVQREGLHGGYLRLRPAGREQKLPARGGDHPGRPIPDRHVRRRDVQRHAAALEGLGHHHRLLVARALDWRADPVVPALGYRLAKD